MKERPILYSSPMVHAKLAGRKTQTRRVAKFKFFEGQNPDFSGYTPGCYHSHLPASGYVLRSRGGGGCWNDRTEPLLCPYGVPGDRLWGRETHAVLRMKEHAVVAYRASCDRDAFDYFDPFRSLVQRIEVKKWTPSIFMRRQYSRILDEVVSVRVERLMDISEVDAIAEGLESARLIGVPRFWWPGGNANYGSARECYLAGWDTINAKTAPAKSNPWVWRIETKPVRT